VTKKKFLFDAMKIKADAFRMPDDGRQWRASAAQRKSMFTNLAAFADKFGRGACPSVDTLQGRTGYSRSTTFRYLADLMLAGWIVNRGKSRFQGTTTWDLNLARTVPDSPLNGVKVEPAMVSKSPSNSVKVGDNSLKVEPTVSKSAVEGASLTPYLPLNLPTESAQNNICPSINLSKDGGTGGAAKTLNQNLGKDIEALSESFMESTEHPFKAFPNTKATNTILAAIEERGFYDVDGALDLFMRDEKHNWKLIEIPAAVFASSLPTYLAIYDRRPKEPTAKDLVAAGKKIDRDYVLETATNVREMVLAEGANPNFVPSAADIAAEILEEGGQQ